MKIDLALISSRLAQARGLQSVEIGEVATHTGIDVTRLARIESGQQEPSGDELLILANYYARDFRDFVDPSRPEPFKQTDILYRRYGQSFTPNDRRAIQEFLFLCEIEATLEKELGRKSTPFSFIPSPKRKSASSGSVPYSCHSRVYAPRLVGIRMCGAIEYWPTVAFKRWSQSKRHGLCAG